MLDLHGLPIDPAYPPGSGSTSLARSASTRTAGSTGRCTTTAGSRRWRCFEAGSEEAGLSARFDAVGNLWGRVEGTDGGNAVVTGSHVDTVRQGGKYDGALGVHMAIAAVQALLQAVGRPKRPLEVLVTCEEEGSRFACSFWGARAIVGRITAEEPSGSWTRTA